MRFLSIAAVVLAISAAGLAQQGGTYKVKHTPPAQKEKKSSAPMGKTPGAKTTATASSANAKELKNAEHQSAKSMGSSHSGAKKSAQIKPVKDKPNPPINFGAKGGAGKNAGLTKQSSNPYKGRLKQKHSR